MVDSARQEGAPGMVKIVLQCCVNTLLSAFDFLNKFTINFAAITGESYCTSARMAYELLKRNLLSAVFVETVSTRLLAGIAFVFSAIYAVVVSSTFRPSFCLQVTVLTVAYIASLLVGRPWVDLENRKYYSTTKIVGLFGEAVHDTSLCIWSLMLCFTGVASFCCWKTTLVCPGSTINGSLEGVEWVKTNLWQ